MNDEREQIATRARQKSNLSRQNEGRWVKWFGGECRGERERAEEAKGPQSITKLKSEALVCSGRKGMQGKGRKTRGVERERAASEREGNS